jgi:hypothetical protein
MNEDISHEKLDRESCAPEKSSQVENVADENISAQDSSGEKNEESDGVHEIIDDVSIETKKNNNDNDILDETNVGIDVKVENIVNMGIGKILEAFEHKLAYDRTKQEQIDRLHKELVSYRSDFITKTGRPFKYRC